MFDTSVVTIWARSAARNRMSLMTCGHASASTQMRIHPLNSTAASGYTGLVSKAFTKEDASTPDDANALPPRTARSPITPSGLARIRQELMDLERASGSEPAQRRARVLT